MSRVSTHSKFQFDSVVEYKVEAIFSQKNLQSLQSLVWFIANNYIKSCFRKLIMIPIGTG